MAEQWTKVADQEGVSSEEVVYDITVERVIRSVQYNSLAQERARLMLQVAEIDIDLTKIEELQAAELI